jgi:hypothetical protein
MMLFPAVLMNFPNPKVKKYFTRRGFAFHRHFEDVTEQYGVDMDSFNLEQFDLSSGTYAFASSFTVSSQLL